MFEKTGAKNKEEKRLNGREMDRMVSRIAGRQTADRKTDTEGKEYLLRDEKRIKVHECR